MHEFALAPAPFIIIIFLTFTTKAATTPPRHGEPTHRLDKLETSQHPCFLVFVVFACLAAVSSDDYQTHRHSSSRGAVCLSHLDLPAGKVKSEQDFRRWMPLCSTSIVDFTGEGGGGGGLGGGPVE